MSNRRKAVKVGMFTFVTGALLALVLVTFGGVKFWKHHDRYFVDFTESVMGLSEGTQVYCNGIKVGKVGSIKVVRVAIDLDRGTPVRADTVAMLNMAGITGLKVIDLQGGSVKAASLPPGAHITVGHGILDKLEAQAERLVDQTSEMVARAKQIMDGANNVIVGMNQIVANVQAVSDPKQLGAVIDATRITAQNLQHASAEINAMVAENRATMKGTFESIGKATENANLVTTDIRALIHNNQGTIAATLADLRQAARTFKDLAREVREKPSRLMFSNAAPDRKLP